MNIVRYSIILRLRSEQFCLFIYLFFLFSVQLVLWHVSQRLMVGRRHGFDFSWLIYGVFNHVHLYLHINPAQKASQMFLVDVYILWHGLLTKSLIPLESLFISLYICKENEKLAKFFSANVKGLILLLTLSLSFWHPMCWQSRALLVPDYQHLWAWALMRFLLSQLDHRDRLWIRCRELYADWIA